MTNVRVRTAVKELRRYYGLNRANPYLSLGIGSSSSKSSNQLLADQPTVLDEFVDLTQIQGDIVKDFMDRLTTKSGTAPGVRSILERVKTLESDGNAAPKSGVPLLITPYVGFDAPNLNDMKDNPLANSPLKKSTRQGTRLPENKNYYTFDDSASVKGAKVSVIQIFSPINSQAATDTDIAALYLSSVNSLEASRAVPYMDISIATAVGIEQRGQPTPISLGRFLGIESKTSLTPGTADHALANGLPITTNYNLDVKPTKNRDGQPIEDIRLVTGVEIFTMPQTLVNADVAYNDLIPNGRVLDPFQPLLSLEGMKLSITGAGGLMSQRSGEITMILHDRARMDEIASLLSPSKFGKTRLIVTYGYSHPAGSQYSSPTSNEQMENAVGVLIDSMKVTEVFMISNISFSFSGQNVKINLQIAPVGAGELSSIDIVYADSPDIKNIKELLDIVNQGIAESNQTTLSKKFVAPSFMSNPNNIAGEGLNEEQLKALEELKKANYTGINRVIEDLFGKNGKGGKVQTLVKNKNQKLDEIFARMMSTPDPFLPSINVRDVNTADYVWNGKSAPMKNTSTYISLGKILSTFIGSSLVNSSNSSFSPENDEVQLIFHPFNRDAGGLQDFNTAQFVIDFDEFKEVIKARFDITGSMSLMKFLALIKRFFLGDLGSIGYGLLDSKQRRIFKIDAEKGGRARAEPKASGARQSSSAQPAELKQGQVQPVVAPLYQDVPVVGPGPTREAAASQKRAPVSNNTTSTARSLTKPKSYEEVLEESKKENLRTLYDVSPSASVTFRPPDVHFFVESIPKSIGWEDDPNKTSGIVIKIHVIDRACSTMSHIGEFLNSMSNGQIIPIEKRPTNVQSFPYTSAHSVYATGFFQSLSRENLIKPINMNEIMDEVQKRKETLEIDKSVLEDLASNYLLFNGNINNAKEIIKKSYSSLIYGSETSGLMSLSFSSENDPQLTSTMLIRSGREENVHSKERDGVPIMIMPASITAETLGCPYLSFAQFFYMDLGTNTDVDNVYSVTSIDHSIESGKFTTSIKMTHFMSYGVFRPLSEELKRTALAAFLAKFNVKKNTQSRPRTGGGKNPTGSPVNQAPAAQSNTTSPVFSDYTRSRFRLGIL